MKVERVDEKRRICKSNWLRHVTRMNSNRMPKITRTCGPNGRRRLESPLKRLLDEPETGLSRPKSWRMTMMMIFMISYTDEKTTCNGQKTSLWKHTFLLNQWLQDRLWLSDLFWGRTRSQFYYKNSFLQQCGKQICSWIKRDQLDVTCFFISLFNASACIRIPHHPSQTTT